MLIFVDMRTLIGKEPLNHSLIIFQVSGDKKILPT